MASYPDGNPGAWPIDGTTPVGLFRLNYGDVTAVAYDPVEPGYRNFEELSDAEIEGFLDLADGSVTRATGRYYLSLAGHAAKTAKSVKDQDLAIDTTKRAADLRALADYWFGLADNEDAESGFEIGPTGTRSGEFIPEGTLSQFGRRYTWGW